MPKIVTFSRDLFFFPKTTKRTATKTTGTIPSENSEMVWSPCEATEDGGNRRDGYGSVRQRYVISPWQGEGGGGNGPGGVEGSASLGDGSTVNPIPTRIITRQGLKAVACVSSLLLMSSIFTLLSFSFFIEQFLSFP